MDASQFLEVVGKRMRSSEALLDLEMTPTEAEDLLDWMENQGGFTAQRVWPSRLATNRRSVAVASDASAKRR
jgi:hypothetical protein